MPQDNSDRQLDTEYLQAVQRLGVFDVKPNLARRYHQYWQAAEHELAVTKASVTFRFSRKLTKNRFVKTAIKNLLLMLEKPAARRKLGPRDLVWRLVTGLPASTGRQYRPLKRWSPSQGSPEVSIIIPVYNKVYFTINCLSSLARLKTKHPFEVVVVDDHSSDRTRRLISRLSGVRYVRNDQNLGFVGSCNHGAAESNGRILVFLNNDTDVNENWLDPLVERLAEDKVGLVGSKLVYPGGLLQEAGGIIFSDASGANYGRLGDPNGFEYNYAREVDYCSGASIAIEKKLFDDIGGFDMRYAPAYYEDTDLAFEVRQRGLRVMYEPRSWLFHFEGITAGTDLSSGTKKYQVINQKKFRAKWKKVLDGNHLEPTQDYTKARNRARSKLALVIDHRVPQDDKDSGSVRMRALLRVLQTMDYGITFWPNDLEQDEPYTARLQADGIEVVYGSRDFSEFSRERGAHYDLIVISRPFIAPSYIEICRAMYPNAKIIYDTVDLTYLREQRQAEIEKDGSIKKRAELWRAVEFGTMLRSDATLVVSDAEKVMLEKAMPGIDVGIVSNIHAPKTQGKEFAQRKDLLFIGGFAHRPNIDAILWFAKEVMPLISKRLPGVTLDVIGSNPTPEVLALKSKSIKILGFVEDVEPLFVSHRVFVSPLRYGAGVKGKIGQAFEYGLPVVTTSVGAEGMHLESGRNSLIVDDAASFAANVVKLYGDQKLWEKLQGSGIRLLSDYFSPKVAKENLKAVIDAI